MPRSALRSLALAAILLAGLPCAAQQPAPPAPPTSPAAIESQPYAAAPYQRVTEDGSGGIALEMAVREFAPPREGMPTVYFAGAVHIGRPEFYAALQEFLDAQTVVLFEGVKPPGSGDPAMDIESQLTPEARARTTARRVRFIAMAVERYRAEKGALPATLEELVSGSERRIATLLEGSLSDAWGNPLLYSLVNGEARRAGYDVVSLGADGKEGGEGPDADAAYSEQKPISAPEAGDRSEGIQQKLADALELEFQLTAMDHDKPNWINSDLAIDQVQARLERSGASADGLFKMLDGSSMMGRLAGFLLEVMSQSEQSRAMLRVMMIEMLSHADKLMESAPAGMGGGKGMAQMMEVLLEDRNAVVVADLQRLVAQEKPPETIGVIYGAGHLPTLEKRLVQEMGYRPAGDTWHTAMDVRPSAAGMSAAQIKTTRAMITRQIESQIKAAQKKPGPKR